MIQSILIFIALLFSVPGMAQQAQLQTEISGPQAKKAQLKLRIVDGGQEARSFLRENAKEIHEETQILVSDLDAKTLKSTFDMAQLAAPVERSKVAFLNIRQPSSDSKAQAKSERIQSLVFASLQSTVSTVAILFVSKLPPDPAMVSVLMSGFFNFYFNWDINRWNNFLYRWQDHAVEKAEKWNLKSWAQSPAFNETAKTATGYIGTAAFAAIFTGVALWDQLWPEICNNGYSRVGQILQSAFFTFAISQPFDSTFGKWLKLAKNDAIRAKVKKWMRYKSLMMTLLTPLVYLQNESAIAAAGGMLTAGLTLAVYDKKADIKKSVQLGLNQFKKMANNLWQSFKSQSVCNFLIGGVTATDKVPNL